jgi:hypothetical protein
MGKGNNIMGLFYSIFRTILDLEKVERVHPENKVISNYSVNRIINLFYKKRNNDMLKSDIFLLMAPNYINKNSNIFLKVSY